MQPRRGLEDQAPVLLEDVEVAAKHMQRRADRFGARLDDAKRFLLLPRHDARHAGFENAGLLAGDGRERVAEEGDVIDGDGRDRGHERLRHDIGGVEPAAKARLQQQADRPGCRRRRGRPRRW